MDVEPPDLGIRIRDTGKDRVQHPRHPTGCPNQPSPMADEWDFDIGAVSFEHAGVASTHSGFDDNPTPAAQRHTEGGTPSGPAGLVLTGRPVVDGTTPAAVTAACPPSDDEFVSGSAALAVLDKAAKELEEDHRFSLGEGALADGAKDLSGVLPPVDGFTPFFVARSGPLRFSDCDGPTSVFRERTNEAERPVQPSVPVVHTVSVVCDHPAVCFGNIPIGSTGMKRVRLLLRPRASKPPPNGLWPTYQVTVRVRAATAPPP